ncbi:MAG: hypothetical protein C6W56_07560 [Caldibacillus debilis]|nr:MAG: hypothetical protein C6W56_07560 [Caldibacillus debilis]
MAGIGLRFLILAGMSNIRPVPANGLSIGPSDVCLVPRPDVMEHGPSDNCLVPATGMLNIGMAEICPCFFL